MAGAFDGKEAEDSGEEVQHAAPLQNTVHENDHTNGPRVNGVYRQNHEDGAERDAKVLHRPQRLKEVSKSSSSYYCTHHLLGFQL